MGVPLRKMSVTAFLAWEDAQSERHEFHHGEVFAMVGSTRGHSRVVANLMRHVGNHLDDGPCQVFSENLRVRVGEDTVLYPDVFVTCDRLFQSRDQAVTTPVLVIEVLSPSTQGYDRSQKFALYRRLSSLREYALIDPDTRRVEIYRLQPDGAWLFLDQSDLAQLSLSAIEFELPLASLFKGMDSQPAA